VPSILPSFCAKAVEKLIKYKQDYYNNFSKEKQIVVSRAAPPLIILLGQLVHQKTAVYYAACTCPSGLNMKKNL